MTTIKADPSTQPRVPAPNDGLRILGPVPTAYAEILTPDALRLLRELSRRFDARRRDLLRERAVRQYEIDNGRMPEFCPETAWVREKEWTVASIPADLTDRRVEITGPVDRKMIINALNSGANVFMADFEDATAPTWDNTMQGQRNLRDAVRGDISYRSPDGKEYRLGGRPATLMVRPRGWHLEEKHVVVDGRPISAALFDFALFMTHNARALVERGTAPYFYLPKLETFYEARLWNDVFNYTQDFLDLPRGTIRATVLIETILAAFQMDEILFELRDHSAGLNCGRWDYIFSVIKKFRNHANFVLPDRNRVTMDQHFLQSYVDLLVKTCHRRGVHAMGGMAAQIPIKGDPVANEEMIEKVMADKKREVLAGHDGTWVAHPALVPVAKGVFDAHMPSPNQITNRRDDVLITGTDLLDTPLGPVTEAGLRLNIDVTIRYLASWLRGAGAVAIYHHMEDAATAEISRSQVWQWIRHRTCIDDGRVVTAGLVRAMVVEELEKLEHMVGMEELVAGRYPHAAKLASDLMTASTFPEFMTVAAYEHLS